MENNTLIRKIHMDCPLCDKTHEVEERKRLTTITIKGDKVNYEERFYFCANADEDENEFVSGSMSNENLLNARNAYRIMHGLLTSDEIIAIRDSYGFCPKLIWQNYSDGERLLFLDTKVKLFRMKRMIQCFV